MYGKLTMGSKEELHLFVIWKNARPKEKEILKDIRTQFDTLSEYEIHWSEEKFAENLTRFYGVSLPSGSDKETHCGKGPFLLVVVRDKNPKYNTHKTSKGPAHINTKMFLAKEKHRDWTGGGHRVHATNTPQEFRHDIILLLGLSPEDYLKEASKRDYVKRQTIKKDLFGSSNWKDLQSLFLVLNNTIPYIVMRNFEPLPGDYYAESHGDIDLLVNNYQEAQYLSNSRPIFTESNRVFNSIVIADEEVMFDLRYVTDGYYCDKWQKDMLETRTIYNGIYVPDSRHYFFSLLLHALIHKESVSPDYITKLQSLNDNNKLTSNTVNREWFDSGKASRLLGKFMAANNYSLSRAEPSVFFNKENHGRVQKYINLYMYLYKIKSLFRSRTSTEK